MGGEYKYFGRVGIVWDTPGLQTYKPIFYYYLRDIDIFIHFFSYDNSNNVENSDYFNTLSEIVKDNSTGSQYTIVLKNSIKVTN